MEREEGGMVWAKIGTGATLAAIAGFATRYAVQRQRLESSSLEAVSQSLSAIGEVEHLSILPLVERLVPGGGLEGEPGVSYLLRADGTNLLFDAGFNPRHRAESALVRNAATLEVDLQSLDGIVISHLHPDHVGGPLNVFRRTFSLSKAALEPKGLPGYVPAPMRHERADVVLTTGPRVIAPGIAVLPPLPRMLFWGGPVSEQAMVVNVRGFGLVLVSGCGHPGIERMMAATEQVLDVPIRAVVGGLHLPVHPLGTPFLAQAILGSPNWPWRPIGERDVAEAIDAVRTRGPQIIALSGHDSTPWTYDAFERAFGDGYRTLRVGEELLIA
jgi:7,8-dihydropterin-6-yl-methyl-4-(beta-D-ribofuranosyl)aminobenzene 5'-phosphate synthase